MKRMNLFCASPASTAVCSSLNHGSMVRQGTRSRHQDSKTYAPCSSQLPFDPKAFFDQKNKKSSAKQSDSHGSYNFADRRESSAKLIDLGSPSIFFRRKNSADISDLGSPSSSSRNLLSDRPYIDWISESDDHVSALVPCQPCAKLSHTGSNADDYPSRRSFSLARSHDRNLESGQVSALVATQRTKSRHIRSNDSPASRSSSSARSNDQVVVLRVSIHCKGCEGKVRKHISKMQGVTSFTTDLETQKVIVKGDVTPLGVLASVSRVKNAEFWSSPTNKSSSPTLSA
uniref:HMA domain-containing protein n=1 Tax=Rhizophora mucronata TaxID=61149 RepID=A0A2P2MY17_RHIMU